MKIDEEKIKEWRQKKSLKIRGAGGKEKTTSYQWKIKIGECDEN